MKLYTTQEIAEILKVTQKTAREMCLDGRISSIKIGRFYRVTEEDLEKFIESCRTPKVRDTTP